MISIAIPIHGMEDGEFFLKRILDSIVMQSIKDVEVVITDNSDDDKLKDIIDTYDLKINYSKNPIKGMAQNTNEAIRRSNGKLIKILYMDDYFAHKDAIKDIIDAFKGHWLVTSCEHNDGTFVGNPHFALLNEQTGFGIGSPSVLTILNEDPLMFDERMTWVLDVDYYKRLFKLYGEPVYVDDINVIIGNHKGQMTNVLTDEAKLAEEYLLLKKYE